MSTTNIQDPSRFACSFSALQVIPLFLGPWRNVTNQAGCCRTFVGDALLVAYGIDTPSCNMTSYGAGLYKLTVTSLNSGSLGLTNSSCNTLIDGIDNNFPLLNILQGSIGSQNSYGSVNQLPNVKCDGKAVALSSSGSGATSSTAITSSGSTTASTASTAMSTAPATTSTPTSAGASAGASATPSATRSGAEKSLNVASVCIWTLAIIGSVNALL